MGGYLSGVVEGQKAPEVGLDRPLDSASRTLILVALLSSLGLYLPHLD